MDQSSAELRDSARDLEVQLSRLQYAQLVGLAELDERNVAGELGLQNLAQLIQTDLRCSYGAAKSKASAVRRFGARWSPAGEPLDPHFPVTATALAVGEISPLHAEVIADAVEELPTALQAERGAEVESALVELARSRDPVSVRVLAQRIAGQLHPDGPATHEARHRQRSRRRFNLTRRADSGGELFGTLTPACQAVWETILAPLAAKPPMDELGEDPRSQAQRMHDAFERAGRLLLASEKLPEQAGASTTLVVTIGLSELEGRVGAATTHHGGDLTVDEVLRIASDGNLIPAVLDDAGGIRAFGRTRRLASSGQHRALFARDRGCTFPDCTKPAARSEIHHLTEWVRGGLTDLNTLAVACGYHSNEAPRQGWQAVMIDGVPYWKPPMWRDPDQVPLRNYVHHPELLQPHLRQATDNSTTR
ncbi:MAG: 13E12 repeat family protein [Actinomycetota bacterium]|nr:13E12 repeat family protein [Actinomycetota bacterium]MDQ2956777.1 13E12 repeat family protein [Actinomycetota bacterium]